MSGIDRDALTSPHSRACGIQPHEHGHRCHSNCPTCKGRDALAPLPDPPAWTACRMIAPICAACGTEVDKCEGGRVHVRLARGGSTDE